MKRKAINAAAILIAAMFTVLTGCGEGASPENDLPEDVPYNHGANAIMETEDGWYTDYSRLGLLNLHFIDKESGADVYLCNRPECMHDGSDSCTATYNNITVTNTVLYDSALYFVGDENDGETLGISLYKAACDGSSLDKVTDIYRIRSQNDIQNVSGEYFIIHKSFAYVPFKMQSSELEGLAGYIDGGLVKVNIFTGEKEEIFSDDEGYYSPDIHNLKGCGDYVYYDIGGMKSEQRGTFRYNTADGSTSPVIDIKNEYDLYDYISGVTAESLYVNRTKDFCLTVEEYDAETFEYKGTAAVTDQRNLAACTLFYDDMIFVCGDDRIDVYKDRNMIGSVTYGEDTNDYSDNIGYYVYQNNSFKISEGYLYIIDSDFSRQNIDDVIRRVSRCSIEDIINGTGKFEPAYTSYDERTSEMLWGDIPGWKEERAEREAAEDEP